MGMEKSGQTTRRYATGSLSFILYRLTTGLDVSVCVAPPPLGLPDFSHCLGADFIFLFLSSSKCSGRQTRPVCLVRGADPLVVFDRLQNIC